MIRGKLIRGISIDTSRRYLIVIGTFITTKDDLSSSNGHFSRTRVDENMKFQTMLLPISTLDSAEEGLVKEYLSKFGIQRDTTNTVIIVIRELKELDSGYILNDAWDNYLEDILGMEIAKVAERKGIPLQSEKAGQFGSVFLFGNIMFQATGRGGAFWSLDGTLKDWDKVQTLIDEIPSDNRLYVEMERLRLWWKDQRRSACKQAMIKKK